MRAKTRALILEKDQIRGMVPGRSEGRKDEVYGAYLKALNPRENEQLQIALASHSDPRFTEFLERLSVPRYKNISLQTIAKACGIDLLEFNQWWGKASSQQSIGIAQNGSVQVVEDMVEDAKSKKVVCERCDGLKFVKAPEGLPGDIPGYQMITIGGEESWIRDCPACEGGRVRKPGDAHSRDKVLEMSGLITKGKTGFTLVQNFGGASLPSAISNLSDMMTLDISAED